MMTITRNKDYKSDYFISLDGKQWNIYKDEDYWYCYINLGGYHWSYQGMGKTRAQLIKEFVK